MTTSADHGYCWVERYPGKGGPRCTLSPGHEGDHHDWYATRDQRDWPAKDPKSEPNTSD